MRRTVRRRRLEAKTDYKARIGLLKSGKPRLIVRRTNRYMIAQIAISDVAQDKVLMSVISKDLLLKGWPKESSGSLKALPAAYLTGYMLGKMAKGKVKEAIFDIGMQRNVKKARLYAVLRGALDAGLEVANDPESLPSVESIMSNKKIKEVFNKIKENL